MTEPAIENPFQHVRLPSIARLHAPPSTIVQMCTTIPGHHNWPLGLIIVVVGGDILYGAGPIPRAWHYVYRNDLREELHLKHTLPVIAAADHGVVAAFDRVVMDFKFHGFNPELCGEWTRIKASS